MKFLIIYHEIGLQYSTVDREQKEILKQLAPSFEKGLLEDVIFLTSVKPRLPEIIDLGSGLVSKSGSFEWPPLTTIPKGST